MRWHFLLGSILVAGNPIQDGSAADWPRWRGPTLDGITRESDWRRDWPAGGLPVQWQAEIGTGFSSFAVAENRLFTQGHRDGNDVTFCFNAESGESIWTHSIPSKLGAKFYEGGPGATPTLDGEQLFTINKWGDVFCLDARNGNVIWYRDLRSDPGVEPNEWGFAGSPLVFEDLVIFNAGETGIALDRMSGRTAWCNGLNPAGYASPIPIQIAGQSYVLIFAAKYLAAVRPRTGEIAWKFPWETGYDNNNADPIVYNDGILITSYSRGAAWLHPSPDGVEVRYDREILNTHLAPPVRIGEYLYGFSGHYARRPDFRCIHIPSGTVQWKSPMPAGSLLGAADQLIILDGTGRLILADPSPESFRPLAQIQVLGGRCWTPPVLAEGLLYCRNSKGTLVCLNLRPTP